MLDRLAADLAKSVGGREREGENEGEMEREMERGRRGSEGEGGRERRGGREIYIERKRGRYVEKCKNEHMKVDNQKK